MFDAAMESAGIADWRSITINQSPSLTESSPLSSVSPQKICMMKFEDSRDVNRENKVGSLMTYRPGMGMGTAPIVAQNIASVSSLLALSIGNELKRNNHTISADGEPCDFAITGAVKEFWINTPSLNIPFAKKRCEGTIEVGISVRRTKDNNFFFSKTYTGTYTGAEYGREEPSPFLMAEALDNALLDLLKNFSQDSELAIKFK
jgi:hypothetical protein